MENKEIIIDGVDVSGCKLYKNLNCVADYCLTDMPFSEAKCELNTNCYYKQLKRKEQECERLKQTLAEIKEIAKLFCNVCKEFEPEKCKPNNYTYCNYNKILAIINETLKDE